MFAFVEFLDEAIATTALELSGLMLGNKPLRIGRPQNYCATSRYGGVPALELKTKCARPDTGAFLREVYFGNLTHGKVDEKASLKTCTGSARMMQGLLHTSQERAA